MKNILNILYESIASAKANNMGLKYIGFGRWVNPNTDKLYMSDGDRLKSFTRKQDRIKFFNNVKSNISNDEFNRVAELIKSGKIVYNESKTDMHDIDKFFGDSGVGAPDFIISYVPSKIMGDGYKLYVNVELKDSMLMFTIYNDNEFYVCHGITKEGNSYVAEVHNIRFPDYVQSSKVIREYMYNMINFYGTLGVTIVKLVCGHSLGAYMWSRYGVDFINSKERDTYKKVIKNKFNETITEKANQNKKFTFAMKSVYSKLTNAKYPWNISTISIKLPPDVLMYADRRIKNLSKFTHGNEIYIGKFLMSETMYSGSFSLYPDSKSYKKYYDYISYKGMRSPLLSESFLVEDKHDDGVVDGVISPYQVVDKKITDKYVWKQDNYDISYEQNMMESIHGRK